MELAEKTSHVQIKNVSNKHMAIIEHMIGNPTAKLGEVAFVFNVSQAWLSSLIHSDMFQAKLKERQDECFSQIALPLREKLHVLAHTGVDKLQEKLEISNSIDEIQSVAELALEAVGYGPAKAMGTPGAGVTFNVNISQSELAAARGKIGRTVDGEIIQSEQAKASIQTSGERGVGEKLANPSPVYSEKD